MPLIHLIIFPYKEKVFSSKAIYMYILLFVANSYIKFQHNLNLKAKERKMETLPEFIHQIKNTCCGRGAINEPDECG